MPKSRMWTVAAVLTVATALVAACSEPTGVPFPTSSTQPGPSPSTSSSTIDPTGRTGCAPTPSACGYPDETNTGVPAGTVNPNTCSVLRVTPGA